jgi:hypothetical protein
VLTARTFDSISAAFHWAALVAAFIRNPIAAIAGVCFGALLRWVVTGWQEAAPNSGCLTRP